MQDKAGKLRVWEKLKDQRKLHAYVLTRYMYVATGGKACGICGDDYLRSARGG